MIEDGYYNASAITTSDSADLPYITRAIYVGVAGDVKVNTAGGDSGIVFKAVPAGTVLRVQAQRVLATGTTATNLLALR